MIRRIITHFFLPVLCLVLLACLTACGGEEVKNPEQTTGEPKAPEQITLRVLTEETNQTGMNGQLELLQEQFMTEHENVTIVVETLPTEEEEKSIYLDRLRTEIMAGRGPDIYLLRSDPPYAGEMLFRDVNQTMHNGLFLDIGEYYDADEDLGKEGLVTAVMDAGCVGDARYVLPLRYDIPVAYVDKAQPEGAALGEEIFASGMTALQEAVISSGSSKLALGIRTFSDAYYSSLNYLPELIDYDTQEVLLTAQPLKDYLKNHQQIMAIAGDDMTALLPNLGVYCSQGTFWASDGYSLYLGSLSECIVNAAIAKRWNTAMATWREDDPAAEVPADIELAMYPVADSDGAVTARVTYYGAVGAGCEYPETAYAFLRLFLSEESQWEQNRQNPERGSGLIGDGWPVRSKGGAKGFWEIFKTQLMSINATDEADSRRRQLFREEITEADLPILDAEIDRVIFDIFLKTDIKIMQGDLFDWETVTANENADIDAFAEEFIQKLQWHVAEG